MSWLSDMLEVAALAVGIDTDEVERRVDAAVERATTVVQATVARTVEAVQTALDVATEVMGVPQSPEDDAPELTWGDIVDVVLDEVVPAIVAEPPLPDTETAVASEAAAGEATARRETQPEQLFRFVAQVDKRTSAVCKACDGTTLPGSHPWWLTHLPPLHPHCRSRIEPVGSGSAVTAAPPTVDTGPFGDAENPWIPTPP